MEDGLGSPKRARAAMGSDTAVGLDALSLAGPEVAESLAVGFRPAVTLSAQDQALFRAFQSNLLSLINHELRTPLMNILNSLNMLGDDGASETPGGQGAGDFTQGELVAIARRNAQRLHRTLSSLLDLAALESGTFHARLKEVNLGRILQNRLDGHQGWFAEKSLKLSLVSSGSSSKFKVSEQDQEVPLLADPQKLGRAIDLCFHAIVPRAQAKSELRVEVGHSELKFQFSLEPALHGAWTQAWTHGMAGFQGGISAPGSAFAGTLQSEEAFLTRDEEGLGSEFLLIHEILRLHHGSFVGSAKANAVELTLSIPELSSEEGLRAVLASRSHQVATELGSVTLALIEVPAGDEPFEFRAKLRRHLFRATDAVYLLADRRLVALVMDDCKPEDAPLLLGRIARGIGVKMPHGTASCPAEGHDPALLVELALRRLRSVRST